MSPLSYVQSMQGHQNGQRSIFCLKFVMNPKEISDFHIQAWDHTFAHTQLKDDDF